MRGEVIGVRGWTYHWQVMIRLPNGRRTYRLKIKEECPDELSAYMAVTRELEQEEQTNGSDT